MAGMNKPFFKVNPSFASRIFYTQSPLLEGIFDTKKHHRCDAFLGLADEMSAETSESSESLYRRVGEGRVEAAVPTTAWRQRARRVPRG